MPTIKGSLNYSPAGRKRAKPQRGRSKTKYPFRPLSAEQPYRRDTKDYPSAETKSVNTNSFVSREKQEISKNFTIAPAYNKGAYQVISVENVKDIGR